MTTHQFPADADLGPLTLRVRVARGDVTISAEDVPDVLIDLDGSDAADTTVERRGSTIEVVGPRLDGGLRSLLGSGSGSLRVHARVPHGTGLVARLGSADLRATGALGDVETAVGSGSIDLTDVASLESNQGSGDVTVSTVRGDARIRTASGDATIGTIDGSTDLTVASGDARLRHTLGPVRVKGASGDVVIDLAETDVTARTASGDLHIREIARGRVEATGASGDVEIGVRRGVPTWTDVSSATRGGAQSELDPVGPPAEGQDHVEVRVRTASGRVRLRHVGERATSPVTTTPTTPLESDPGGDRF